MTPPPWHHRAVEASKHEDGPGNPHHCMVSSFCSICCVGMNQRKVDIYMRPGFRGQCFRPMEQVVSSALILGMWIIKALSSTSPSNLGKSAKGFGSRTTKLQRTEPDAGLSCDFHDIPSNHCQSSKLQICQASSRYRCKGQKTGCLLWPLCCFFKTHDLPRP